MVKTPFSSGTIVTPTFLNGLQDAIIQDEANLTANINTIITNQTENAGGTIKTAIGAEATRARAAEAQEVSDRTAAVANEVTARNSAILIETLRAQGAESELSSRTAVLESTPFASSTLSVAAGRVSFDVYSMPALTIAGSTTESGVTTYVMKSVLDLGYSGETRRVLDAFVFMGVDASTWPTEAASYDAAAFKMSPCCPVRYGDGQLTIYAEASENFKARFRFSCGTANLLAIEECYNDLRLYVTSVAI